MPSRVFSLLDSGDCTVGEYWKSKLEAARMEIFLTKAETDARFD
jgi:hypothetical protein